MSTPQGSVSQSSLRSVNLSVVLAQVLGSPVPSSRARVAQATGMTRSTASRLVDDLVRGGLVGELDVVTDGRRGRPATPLAAPRGTVAALGLEVNVSLLCARVVDLSGEVLAEQSAVGDYRRSEPRRVLGELAAMAGECLDALPGTTRVVGGACALPGLVDDASGLLLRAPNLGWREVDVKAGLRAAGLDAGLELHVANEADCSAATVAFGAPGRASALQDFLYVSGEVGIGSALVLDGEVRLGRHGWAGEIGHVCVDPAGPGCACGARGCLEAVAGRLAMCQAAGADGLDALKESLAQGDQRAMEVVAAAGRALGIALAGALNMLDVPTVVLGGHLGRLIEALEPHVLHELDARLLAGDLGAPQLLPLALDESSAATGAAYGALRRVILDPAAHLPG